MNEPWNLDAGNLYQRVTVEKKTIGADTTRGHPTVDWKNYLVNVAARIYTPSGRKLELTRQLVPTATHIVEVRYRPEFIQMDANRDEGDRAPEKFLRVNYEDRIFNIGFVNDIEERHVRIEFLCTEERNG